MARVVDFNSDLGESFGTYRLGDDEAVLAAVTSANVACGYHAGDPAVMRRTLAICKQRGVAPGAHPGYPDLLGFGRRAMAVSPDEVYDYVLYQIGALHAMARAAGVELQHVKAHGAMYNQADVDPRLAQAIASAIKAFDPELILVAPATSAMAAAGQALGLRVAAEVFADRAYTAEGRLVDRKLPGAMITDPREAAARVLEMVEHGVVTAIDGTKLPVKADSVCVHGDSPSAVSFAVTVRQALVERGIEVRPLREWLS
ncbi:MAG: LamB/YcsF family protein [Chloroflexota bacterium]